MDRPLKIHALLPYSRVNGPGLRAVVFFQGCARGCPGCFNPDTHPMEAGEEVSALALLQRLPRGIEGLTVSGGEPFLQPEGLASLLRGAKGAGLSTVVYTGFTLEELKKGCLRSEALEYIDVLIDGPFLEGEKETTLLARGSKNQRLHFLTGRYSIDDLVMPGRSEIRIGRDGAVTETGFSSMGSTILRSAWNER